MEFVHSAGRGDAAAVRILGLRAEQLDLRGEEYALSALWLDVEEEYRALARSAR